MTKKIFFSFIPVLLILSVRLTGQDVQLPVNKESKLIEYTELVTVESSLTQKILYSKAKDWFDKAFKSSDNVIQKDDKEEGIIIGKGIIPVKGGMYLTDGKIDFTLKVQVKDGRYKYWISNFSHKSYKEGYSGGALENEKPACGNFNMVKKGWTEVKEIADQNAKKIIKSLKDALSMKSAESEKDNW